MRLSKYTMISVFLLALAGQRCAAAPVPVNWQAGAGTREVENGAVVENDLVYVKGNGQSQARYYPQAAVVQCGPLTGAPGRYRVHVRARTLHWGASSLVLQAWVAQADGGAGEGTGYGWIPTPVAARPMSGSAFAQAGQWQDFTLEFDREAGDKPTQVGLMYLGETTPPAAGTVQVDKASLSVERLDLPLTISYALSTKLRYKHPESGEMQVHLTNSGDQSQSVQVSPIIVDQTEQATTGAAVGFTVPASETVQGVVPFAVPAQDGGYELRAEARVGGKVVDSRSADVFCVSDSPFQCAIQSGSEWPRCLSWAGSFEDFKPLMTTGWDGYVADCQAALAKARRRYCTYSEYFAWAREDATMLTMDTDEPYLSGQTCYAVSRKQIRLLNGLMKSQGIAPVAYVNYCPFGWPGFEVMRKHPEWYAGSDFNTELLEEFQNNDQKAHATYPCIGVNVEARSANGGQTYLQYHLDQLKASVAMYGWEAFRYDAGPWPTKYFPTVKAFLAQLNPPVGIGDNLGVYCLGNQPSADWTTYCRDGSWMMEEGIIGAFHSPTDPHRRWVDWIDLLHTGNHLTRSNGGHYTYINGSGNWLSTALGFAVGGHPWATQDSPYCDQNRFMIRYGYYFWDLRTQFLDSPEKTVSVTSARPLWWQQLASERRLSAGHRQVIIPLFNPPTGPEVVDTTTDAPAEGVTVALSPAAGEKVTAFLLTPEPVAQREALPVKTLPDGRVQVTVPTFWAWTNVVFDCEGK